MKHTRIRTTFALATLLSALSATLDSGTAVACGGLFCSQSAPVNQAAERIIFAQAGNTTTAIIEIRYDGPSESFSWVLPVPGRPEVGLSSTQALDQLQAATNPVYQLNTTRADCGDRAVALNASADSAPRGQDGVQVLESGNVGPYDYELLEVDADRGDAAGLVLEWLGDNGYDVSALGEELLADYLAQGLNLLAFKLNKNAAAGAIRPIRISYEGSQPMIPIRPTAVAANPDMGILVWVLGEHRAIPQNYLSLELNELLIDWFNPSGTYDAVVTRAANDAGGQGFVTEMSDSTALLRDGIFIEADYAGIARAALASSSAYDAASFEWEMVRNWDGFDDVILRTVPLPAGTSPTQLSDCLGCVLDMLPAVNRGELEADLPPAAAFGIEQRPCEELDLEPGAECTLVMGDDGRPLWDPERFIEELERLVIDPMRQTQAVIDGHDTFTRFYTTMSADEMTADPVFDFNPELEAVSNRHIRERLIGCNDNWEVLFPEGRISNDQSTWPVNVADMPSNRRVLQHGISGAGMVLEDNGAAIRREVSKLRQYPVTTDSCGCRVVGATAAIGWRPLGLAGLLLAFATRRFRLVFRRAAR